MSLPRVGPGESLIRKPTGSTNSLQRSAPTQRLHHRPLGGARSGSRDQVNRCHTTSSSLTIDDLYATSRHILWTPPQFQCPVPSSRHQETPALIAPVRATLRLLRASVVNYLLIHRGAFRATSVSSVPPW